jgi:adenylosuccinate lyase
MLIQQELGLAISDGAIEQMKSNLDLDEHQMRLAAEEEKKRRRESLSIKIC